MTFVWNLINTFSFLCPSVPSPSYFAAAVLPKPRPSTRHIWSFPFLGPIHTENVPVKPGGQYQEPWRLGSIDVSGVAIKILTQSDGIYTLVDGIDFGYSIENKDKLKAWIHLTSVGGGYLHRNLTFHSCTSQYNSTDVVAHECDATDKVELVLCGITRTIPAKEVASLEQIQACHHPTDNDIETSNNLDYHGYFEQFPIDMAADECEEQLQNPQFTTPWLCNNHWLNPLTCNKLKTNNEPSVDGNPFYGDDSSVVVYEVLIITNPPVVHNCEARVIYPGRRTVHASPTPRATYTFPLKSREQRTSLCQVIEKYHPGVIPDCDEGVVKAHDRALYPEICDAKYKPLLLGCSCEQVTRKLRDMCPDIVSDIKMIRQGYNIERRECLYNFCKPAIPGIDCVHAAGMLRVMIESLGVSYTEVINEDLEGCPPTLVRALDGRPIICILRLCAALYAESECEVIQALLQHNVKAGSNQDLEFSIGDTTCGD
ncbi:hypothetical protein COCMIDRAFT_6762 [Bipolaris oryzae ATCC 44560]|uniref:Uncharacterized protein n=1 Tax=Bipolaris oryzae ATCC 44560 TaxID=930090 RepID=W6Z288_COCMI|nr:uncharacterized protein COCMIDRAFT_6762 [Bipolaris oryzae ATCC 44560]EUC43818.1 hypothetical protein COCMIDRAFT_6762 [Bipolaris oryzae ATCC 44560]